ncbi:MAG TPA: hypothetical protein VKG38_05265 [Solirubrobacteraceae bacterium]|nr:hypothetical protein [Solirubrobacteraceae bacterium]
MTTDHDTRKTIRSCVASACAWRRCGKHLRTMATADYLQPQQSAQLLREAQAADRQADWWLTGAIEAP